MINDLINKTIEGKGDSDQHLMTIFSIALSCKGSCYLELGVRNGSTTKPIVEAAKINNADVYSVDINENKKIKIKYKKWKYCIEDSISFLQNWKDKKKQTPDFIYIDDWHSYEHVKNELNIIDSIISPATIILIHDLMYGNTCPFYHSDLTLKDGQWANGGPYRAVAELDNQFWEFSTLPWNNGLTILRKKYSTRYKQK